jgi:HPt (histidine-containing phosphotransfer) domain-containing protein
MQTTEQTIRTKMINSTDFPESGRVRAIFEQINVIVETCDILSQLFEQAKDPTSKSKIQKIIQNQTEDTNSIELISHSVSVLQNLLIRIKRMAQSPGATENNIRELQHASIYEEDDFFMSGFITEANEHIKSAEAALLELRTKPDDKEVLNQIFRAFYTIKGMAGYLKLIDIASLAHSTENLLNLASKGKLKLEDKTIDVIFESHCMLKNMIADLMKLNKTSKVVSQQKNIPQMLEKLKSLMPV